MNSHTTNNTLRTLSAALLLAACSPILAAPALPVAAAVLQPDGTSIALRAHGDEYFHVTSFDDLLVEQDADGFWCYLELGIGGLTRSSQRAGLDSPPATPAGLTDAAELFRAQPRQPRRWGNRKPTTSLATPLAGVAMGLPGAPTGSEPILILLVAFSNRTLTYAESVWVDRFFGAGKSVNDYYGAASKGLFSFLPAAESAGTPDDGVVTVTLATAHPNPMGGGLGLNPNRQVVSDALAAADAMIDYASYDIDGNGALSSNELHVVTILAGYERAVAMVSPSIWGHRDGLGAGTTVPAPTLDGVVLGDFSFDGGYVQIGEIHSTAPVHAATIGVLCHELGHDFGLPDLYDTDPSDGTSGGIGYHGIMGFGTWGSLAGEDFGDTPVMMCAWSRVTLGFLTPTRIFSPGFYGAVETAALAGNAFKIAPIGAPSGEYFLIENRQFTGYDAGLATLFALTPTGSPMVGGIQIWHIDESVSDNGDETRKLVDLEEANELAAGGSQLDASVNFGIHEHLYYMGGAAAMFSDVTTPSSLLNSGASARIVLGSFSAPGTTITFAAGGVGLGLCGDVTGDGAIAILDALGAAQMGVGLLPEDAIGDVNSSGSVTIIDALRIAQFSAGLPVTFMCP